MPLDNYCVLTATLEDPRIAPPASLNCTKIRLCAGSNGMPPFAAANMEKVGVAFVLIMVVTLEAGVAKHCPVPGSL
jgi:hypothetical protein